MVPMMEGGDHSNGRCLFEFFNVNSNAENELAVFIPVFRGVKVDFVLVNLFVDEDVVKGEDILVGMGFADE
jgi:hypothetical protein